MDALIIYLASKQLSINAHWKEIVNKSNRILATVDVSSSEIPLGLGDSLFHHIRSLSLR